MTTSPLNIIEIYKTELPKMDFVFKGFKGKTIGFVSSAGGTGKSMLALHLAFSLADTSCKYNFMPMIDENTPRGRVTYLSLEDPQDVLEHRIKAITQCVGNYNILEEINSNLAIYPLYGKNFSLYREKRIQKEELDILLKLGETSRLVVIDTFRRLHDEDENNNGTMSEILKLLESVCNQTGTSILLLHHQNKNAINEKNNNQTAMRGASALVDNARLVINLSTLTEKEAKEYNIEEEHRKEYIKVSYAKVNYAKPLEDFILARGFRGTLSLCNCKKIKGDTNANGKRRKKI